MSQSSSRARRKQEPVSWETVRQVALEFPGTEEGTSYGTSAIKVRGKLFVRLREEGEAFVIACDFENRELLMREQPEVFYITDHYLKYRWILVRLSTVRRDQLHDMLRQAWLLAAPKGLVAAMRRVESP